MPEFIIELLVVCESESEQKASELGEKLRELIAWRADKSIINVIVSDVRGEDG